MSAAMGKMSSVNLVRISCLGLCALGLHALAGCSSNSGNGGAVGGATGTSGGTGGTSAATGGTPAMGGTGTGGTANGAGGDVSPPGGQSTGGSTGLTAGTGGGGGSSTGGAPMGGTGGASGGATGGGGASMGGVGGAVGGSGGAGGSGGVAAFALTSPAFNQVDACSEQNHTPCEVWPTINLLDTIQGGNQSPALSWGPGPMGTMSYAIVLHDYSNMFTHWAIWNIPAATTSLPANLPTGAMPAMPAGASQIAFGHYLGYAGPGAHDHVYELRLYALSVATFTPAGNLGTAGTDGMPAAVRSELENDPNNIVLGTTDLRGVTPP